MESNKNNSAFVCGSFDNGTEKCCRYCVHFMLWGICTGYCSVKSEDVMTSDKACEKYSYDVNWKNEEDCMD